jgi:hypothetical protein
MKDHFELYDEISNIKVVSSPAYTLNRQGDKTEVILD